MTNRTTKTATTTKNEAATQKENEAMSNAMTEAMEEITEAAEEAPKAAPKRKAKKPAAKKPTTKQDARDEEQPEEPKKPEPTTYAGFEVAEGVNPSDIQTMEAETADCLSNIQGKDAALLGDYLTLGKFLSSIGAMFKSTKIAGEYRKKNLPESENLDPALRSNCKWVWEALNLSDHEGSDLLSVLGVNRLEDYKSQNPTVIKRAWRDAKKAEETKAKAEELGVEEEEVSKAEKEAKKAEEEAKIEEALDHLHDMLMQHKKREDIAREACSVVEEIFGRNKKDAIDYVSSL